jgi:hypothetical protein
MKRALKSIAVAGAVAVLAAGCGGSGSGAAAGDGGTDATDAKRTLDSGTPVDATAHDTGKAHDGARGDTGARETGTRDGEQVDAVPGDTGVDDSAAREASGPETGAKDAARDAVSDACMSMTCAREGFDCGMQGDGCGNVLDCGTCATGQVCGGGLSPQPGVCGAVACVPRTCAQQGFNCGMATDGCGEALNCGASCPTGEMCGVGGPNVCGGDTCPVGSELVYVWGDDNNIYSFDPPTKTFTKVATPDCDASSPNAMAIDRNLVAWLNYLTPGSSAPNDYIYKFDLTKGTGCQASGIQIPPGFTQVGMGFSSDTPGGTTETLYVDGFGGAGLASVDMTTLTIVPIGDFSNDPKLEGQSCELTGTGSALLYGYFTTSPYVRVAQLDKTNSNAISDTQLQGFTPPDDWAFSFWGGDFYLYAYPNASNSPNSSAVQYDPTTNALNLAYVANVGFTIIGAGVSTCAPTTP